MAHRRNNSTPASNTEDSEQENQASDENLSSQPFVFSINTVLRPQIMQSAFFNFLSENVSNTPTNVENVYPNSSVENSTDELNSNEYNAQRRSNLVELLPMFSDSEFSDNNISYAQNINTNSFNQSSERNSITAENRNIFDTNTITPTNELHRLTARHNIAAMHCLRCGHMIEHFRNTNDNTMYDRYSTVPFCSHCGLNCNSFMEARDTQLPLSSNLVRQCSHCRLHSHIYRNRNSLHQPYRTHCCTGRRSVNSTTQGINRSWQTACARNNCAHCNLPYRRSVNDASRRHMHRRSASSVTNICPHCNLRCRRTINFTCGANNRNSSRLSCINSCSSGDLRNSVSENFIPANTIQRQQTRNVGTNCAEHDLYFRSCSQNNLNGQRTTNLAAASRCQTRSIGTSCSLLNLRERSRETGNVIAESNSHAANNNCCTELQSPNTTATCSYSQAAAQMRQSNGTHATITNGCHITHDNPNNETAVPRQSEQDNEILNVLDMIVRNNILQVEEIIQSSLGNLFQNILQTLATQSNRDVVAQNEQISQPQVIAAQNIESAENEVQSQVAQNQTVNEQQNELFNILYPIFGNISLEEGETIDDTLEALFQSVFQRYHIIDSSQDLTTQRQTTAQQTTEPNSIESSINEVQPEIQNSSSESSTAAPIGTLTEASYMRLMLFAEGQITPVRHRNIYTRSRMLTNNCNAMPAEIAELLLQDQIEDIPENNVQLESPNHSTGHLDLTAAVQVPNENTLNSTPNLSADPIPTETSVLNLPATASAQQVDETPITNELPNENSNSTSYLLERALNMLTDTILSVRENELQHVEVDMSAAGDGLYIEDSESSSDDEEL